MRKMLRMMKERLENQEPLVLVTVTASSGATPRGAGARMLIGREGRICGTIGGGAVEYRSEQIAGKVMEEKNSCGHDFSLTRDDVENLGMICGGACNVFFHYLPAGDKATIALAREAEMRFAQDAAFWLVCDMGAGGKLWLTDRNDLEMAPWLTRHPRRIREDGKDLYVEQIHSPGRVYVFGGGHVAQELVPVLAHVGFRCIVMDDRQAFARKELFPDAEQVILGDFQKIGEFVSVGREDYVCVMTRGHACDTVIQAQVLKCQPCYCGVIGSRKKAAGVRKILKEEYGLLDEELNRITTPIGLPIQAETPAEIAISIAGQMIQRRAERNGE